MRTWVKVSARAVMLTAGFAAFGAGTVFPDAAHADTDLHLIIGDRNVPPVSATVEVGDHSVSVGEAHGAGSLTRNELPALPRPATPAPHAATPTLPQAAKDSQDVLDVPELPAGPDGLRIPNVPGHPSEIRIPETPAIIDVEELEILDVEGLEILPGVEAPELPGNLTGGLRVGPKPKGPHSAGRAPEHMGSMPQTVQSGGDSHLGPVVLPPTGHLPVRPDVLPALPSSALIRLPARPDTPLKGADRIDPALSQPGTTAHRLLFPRTPVQVTTAGTPRLSLPGLPELPKPPINGGIGEPEYQISADRLSGGVPEITTHPLRTTGQTAEATQNAPSRVLEPAGELSGSAGQVRETAGQAIEAAQNVPGQVPGAADRVLEEVGQVAEAAEGVPGRVPGAAGRVLERAGQVAEGVSGLVALGAGGVDERAGSGAGGTDGVRLPDGSMAKPVGRA
ncbi:hypothetical protein SAMN04489712_104162 [Thermomonospora echinospora]|uniref:Uncharacterized protein n=1 Tax=Thermomonospora echinospora TaxID=1992 RepID=A0A1H5YTN0_9ACTN|nr:hypothetical protein [Thermomonospora echinospora]SEG27072.1 hypothetical protein SAMN04489712_104162 [Thermomonospora echinospora]